MAQADMVMGLWPAVFQRQRRASIPAWGNAPGSRSNSEQGLKARIIHDASIARQRLLHLVFSTKDRSSCLGTSVRPALHAYLATVARNTGCQCPRVGGVADHVHLAIQFSRTITIATLVEELKTSSSKRLKTQSSELSSFAWQRGYGVFSVGPGDLDALLAYIDNQEENHRTRTFQGEYRAFLTKYGVAYDERYVWD